MLLSLLLLLLLLPSRESNQILLIAHYLKRLSGAVMWLQAGSQLRDFLVYRCWRVLKLSSLGELRQEGETRGRRRGGVGINT